VKNYIMSVRTRGPVYIEMVPVSGDDLDEAKDAALEELKEELLDADLIWDIEELEDDQEA
jgi:glycosyltransferase A (GT-A) superfamily protein (DUF2064 family)